MTEQPSCPDGKHEWYRERERERERERQMMPGYVPVRCVRCGQPSVGPAAYWNEPI